MVPRSSVVLVLGFWVRVKVRVSLSHLRTIEPSDYRYAIVWCSYSRLYTPFQTEKKFFSTIITLFIRTCSRSVANSMDIVLRVSENYRSLSWNSARAACCSTADMTDTLNTHNIQRQVIIGFKALQHYGISGSSVGGSRPRDHTCS